jgi:ABC-type sugar transport system ATPase subunit
MRTSDAATRQAGLPDLDGATPVLRLTRVSKSFGHVQALQEVDFELLPGEVMAIVGDNGAGKSTLIKIISGAYQPDSGKIELDGSPIRITTPRMARDLGIATVYQDLALVDQRSVAANLFLGREPHRSFFVDKARMLREAERVLSDLHIRIPSVHAPVGVLSGGQRQAVAIGRAMAQGGRVVILDEPTAALGLEQSHVVVELIHRLKASGHSVIVISHNLQHVFSVADRITVLRGGRRVAVRTKLDVTGEEIIKLILGAELL